MNQRVIEFKALSPIIVSPRDDYAFYKSLDFEEKDLSSDDYLCGLNPENINVIYPFYRYGNYSDFSKNKADYYLPGSSVKGAIMHAQLTKVKSTMMVDDISIDTSSIVLKQLFKFQYLSKEKDDGIKKKNAKLQPFFPNIAFESIKTGTEFKSVVFRETNQNLSAIFERVKDSTRCKLMNFIHYLRRLQEFNPNIQEALELVIGETLKLKKKNCIFLGGYKGQVLAFKRYNIPEKTEKRPEPVKSLKDIKIITDKKDIFPLKDIHSSIYIDSESNIPFGMIEFNI